MGKVLVVLLACLGLAAVLGRFFPTSSSVAFVAGGYGITWFVLVILGGGFFIYKRVK